VEREPRGPLLPTSPTYLEALAGPETGNRYTVKRYSSENVEDDDTWRDVKISLMPINPAFDPIELTSDRWIASK
jgi:hypothetical protein